MNAKCRQYRLHSPVSSRRQHIKQISQIQNSNNAFERNNEMK